MYMYKIPRSESVLENKYYKSYKVDEYTGAKDSKGRNVYTGDIIRGCYTAEVKYNEDDCCFWLKNINNISGGMLTKEYVRNFTVIGNIHENPELLTGGCYA